MFKKKGQFSIEFLLIFIFMMTVVSLIIVGLGTLSLEISLDEKRKEVDDFANSILKEFEIMQSVQGGYFRDFEIPSHFMSRFDVKIDGDYLIVSDLFSYDEGEFVRYYKIPGENYFSTSFNSDFGLVVSLCKKYSFDEERVDFFSISGVNDDFCFNKLVDGYVLFFNSSVDLIVVSGITNLNLEVKSNSGFNTIYLREFESGVYYEHDFGQFDAPISINFEHNLSSKYLMISFKNDTNINTFSLVNNGIKNVSINPLFGLVY
ncbi:MAG: hypothetical protein HRU03_08905 [Nanoarchaeales archaeon]|nr:hypothetical protein [Nanoarchaeales archaeon]